MLRRALWPLLTGLLLFLIYASFRFAGVPASGEAIQPYLLAASWVALSVAGMRVVGSVLFDIIFVKRNKRPAPAILRALFFIAIYPPLLLLIYSTVFQQSVTGITATSAAVTFLVGLALQDTLGNFFAGVSIHTENPFHIGDTVKIRDVIGRVEAVSWRTTTIRTNNDSLVIFPNSVLAKDPLEVYALDTVNRRVLSFPAPYEVPPQEVVGVIREAVLGVSEVELEIPPTVRIQRFDDSSILYEVLYWIKDYLKATALDATIRERIWYAFHRHNIDFPYPVRHTLQGAKDDGTRPKSRISAAILDDIDILQPLSAEEREKVSGSLVSRLYAPQERIIRYGDTSDSMFIIARGQVEVCIPSEGGGSIRVDVLGPGSYVGEMGLFTGEPRSADIYTLEETIILEIQKENIESLLKNNVKLAEAFSHKIAERQLRLQQCNEAPHESEHISRTESILDRIKRFFEL